MAPRLASSSSARPATSSSSKGAYDLVAISEFPGDATAATFVLRIGMLGNVRTTTIKAFPENAYRKIVDAV